MPQNPKRFPKKKAVAFDDNEVLYADDPRPQRVTQYPTGARRMKKAEEAIPTAVFNTEQHDQELQAHYGMQEPTSKPAFLYVERGPGAGQLLEVKQGNVVVGRASVSDLRLQHPSISRRHAQIKRVGERFYVKDLGSQNGTFVNKTRIAGEVEIKPGDILALGNAVVKLRGPLARGEKLGATAAPSRSSTNEASSVVTPPPTHRAHSTAVVQRPSGQLARPNVLKIAIFAGAVGFGLAAVFAVALVKTVSNQNEPAKKTVVAKKANKVELSDTDRERAIQDAIERKMKERAAATAPQPEVNYEPEVEAAAPVVVVRNDAPVAAAPTPKVRAAPTPRRTVAKATPRASARDEEEEESAAPAKGGGNRSAILAAYEKGNAEDSLDAAKRAGDKALASKLQQFLTAYDKANEAMLSNNGSAAISNFQKALKLDEELSSGWGRYGGEIRKQLANLYTLVGLQFISTGDTDKAKQAFEGALKHDPRHARAKAQLAKLSGGGGGKSAAEAADDAFDEGPAPKKSKAQAIDDAFGD